MAISIITKPSEYILFSGNDMPVTVSAVHNDLSYVRLKIGIWSVDSSGSPVQLAEYAEDYCTDTDDLVSVDPYSYPAAWLEAHAGAVDLVSLMEGRRWFADNWCSVHFDFLAIDADGADLESVACSYDVIRGATTLRTDYFLARLNSYGALLSCAPEKFVSAQCPAVFSFYNSEERTVQACAVYDDSTTPVVLLTTTLQQGVTHFAFSYSNLKAYNGGAFEALKLFVRAPGGDNLSTVLNYRVDLREHGQQRTLIFENSFGGIDSVRLLGTGQRTDTFSRATYTHDGVTRDVDVTSEEGLEADTGAYALVSEEPLKYQRWLLPELMRSTGVFLITDEYMAEVRIKNEEAQVWEDRQYLSSNSIEFEVVKLLKVFNPPEALEIWGEDFSLDFNNDFNILV